MNYDNPYAAPQAPPEKRPRGTWEVYLRVGLVEFAVFFGTFFVAATLAIAVVAGVKDWPEVKEWYGPSFPEEAAWLGALAFGALVGTVVGIFAVRRELRHPR